MWACRCRPEASVAAAAALVWRPRAVAVPRAGSAAWASPCAGTAGAAPSRARAASRTSSSSTAAVVNVSASRLEEFLTAELAYLGNGTYRTITLGDILQHRAPDDLYRLAQLIQRELPLRFATRIRQIEDTTPGWRGIPELAHLHEMILTSFKRLRLVELGPGPNGLHAFTEVVRDVQQRHMRNLVPSVARAARVLKECELSNERSLDQWLGKFMNSRLGSHMLLQHYEALLADPDVNHIGIVDMRCDPVAVCRRAIEHVKTNLGGSDIDVQLQVAHQNIEFSFMAGLLFNMVAEVLLNSVRATQAAAERGKVKARPIKITVCADSSRVAIQISDKAGGIPCHLLDRVWEYMFSTAPGDGAEWCSDEVLRADMTERGMGLPLCRLYARYLGGSFDLMTMPGVGTDAYIYLNRIDAA